MKTCATIAFLLLGTATGAVSRMEASAGEFRPLSIASIASVEWTQRVERGRHFLEGVTQARECCGRSKRGAMDFLADPTLRLGDVVVTEKGLLMFWGDEEHRTHSPNEFTPITKVSPNILDHSHELLEIQRVSTSALRIR
jgi:hypothetical protein